MNAPIPLQCRIANFLGTAFFLLLIAAVLCAFGSMVPEHVWTAVNPHGDRIFRITGIGMQLEFDPPRPRFVLHGSPGDSTGFDFLGLTVHQEVQEWRNAGIRWRNTVIGVPWWPVVIYFLARPTYRMLCRIDQDRLRPKTVGKPTHCHVCGYDLRATPQRCPECGTVPGA